MAWTPYTIVFKHNLQPVLPFDCNPNNPDEGMLVYRSEGAAKSAADHQRALYDLEPIIAVTLASVQAHEANVVAKIGKGRKAVEEQVFKKPSNKPGKKRKSSK